MQLKYEKKGYKMNNKSRMREKRIKKLKEIMI